MILTGFDGAGGHQPARIASGDHELQQPGERQEQKDRVEQAHAASIWKPALKPGPRADIR